MTSDARSPVSVRRSQGGLAENQVPRRSAFVGRARELHQLQAAFETAAMGQGRLIMLVGGWDVLAPSQQDQPDQIEHPATFGLMVLGPRNLAALLSLGRQSVGLKNGRS